MEFLPKSGADPQEAGREDNPQLQSSPDYGSLGPNPDVISAGAGNHAGGPTRFASLMAVAVGVLLAVLVAGLGSAQAAWTRFAQIFRQPQTTSIATSTDQLESMKPQKQAEALLELAVAHSDDALDQISSRVDRWQGKLTWDSQIANLATAALNSNDMRVRESGIEVELAAYGLGKNPASLQYVLKMAKSTNHAQKSWALWELGLLGNRGVEVQRVTDVLTTQMKDADEDLRHWAVEGLALLGKDEALPALMAAMHDDPSPVVREQAACAVAQSGMFTREQRLSAVPQLLSYTDDPALDVQTRRWAFQALAEITGEHFPNDSAAWRSWYASRN